MTVGLRPEQQQYTRGPKGLSSDNPGILGIPPPTIDYPPHIERIYSQLFATFTALGRPSWSFRLRDCFYAHIAWECADCKAVRYFPMPCHIRLCPKCATWRAFTRLQTYHKPLEDMSEPALLTLTFLSQPTLTRQTVAHCQRSLKNFRHSTLWKDNIRGGLLSLEFTHSQAHGWHPHLHALVDTPFIPIGKIVDAWHTASGAIIAHIKRVDAHRGYREIVKYPYKPGKFLADPDLVAQLYDAIYNRRLFTAVGSFYRAGDPPEPRHKKPFPDNRFAHTNIVPPAAPRLFECPICGGHDIQCLGPVHPDPTTIPVAQAHLPTVPQEPYLIVLP